MPNRFHLGRKLNVYCQHVKYCKAQVGEGGSIDVPYFIQISIKVPFIL